MAAEKPEQAMEDQAQASVDSKPESKEMETLAPEFQMKHPLQHKWTLWFFRNSKGKTWEENLCEITSFDTIEDFWALYNHIELPSKLAAGCDYSLFKHGVKPMWEDERNRHGGRWLLTLTRPKGEDLDSFWLETLMCLIGEAFDEQSDDICGAVVNVRQRGHKIAVWTGNARNEEPIRKIGYKLKERLLVPANMTIGYQSHEDTMSKSGSTTKNRITL